MKIHLIAIGGAVMHNLAIALHKKGYDVTGSDDEIFEPAKSRLEEHGLLPDKSGWFPNKIKSDIDIVILGMHARDDNPELVKAYKLGIKTYSFPEYLYEQCKEKTRVVIGGSHGKTTITSMIMHVLNQSDIIFDYMVGAQIEGFDTMVKLSHDAKIAVFEGDEYLASALDRRPKFHLYKPHIALLSGIAWDHINVFPTFENYVDQFRIFADKIEEEGCLIYFSGDKYLQQIAFSTRESVRLLPYNTHPHVTKNNVTWLISGLDKYPLNIFGEHNLQNIKGAKLVCNQLGITDDQFYESIVSFKGASKRLQLLKENLNSSIFLDFAHSPSKLMATTKAVKTQFPDRNLVACMELHTFSSLNHNFLKHYKNSMAVADKAIVYFSPETIKHKKLADISKEQVMDAFGGKNLEVIDDADEFREFVYGLNLKKTNLLIMSSGNFHGIDFLELADKLLPD